jgi:hypothetical protein
MNKPREKKALSKHLSALADKPHTRIMPGEARWIAKDPSAPRKEKGAHGPTR